MLDRLTDLDDHELDEQAAIFLHAKKNKKDPQSRLVAKTHRKNNCSDAESLVTSYEDRSAFKFRPLVEPFIQTGDKRKTLKGKASLNNFQPRELSVETSDGALNSLRTRRSNESDAPTSNTARISKKPSKSSTNFSETKKGNRLFSYTSDGGDSEEEEYFVYPKHRTCGRNSPKRNSSNLSLNEAMDKHPRSHSGTSGVSKYPDSRKSDLSRMTSPRISRTEHYQPLGSTDQERRPDRHYQHHPSYLSDSEDDGEYITQWRHDKRMGRSLAAPKKGAKQREESLGPRSFRRSRQQESTCNGDSEEEEETLPLFWKMNPEAKRRKRKPKKVNPLFGTLSVFIIIFALCTMYSYTTIPLDDVSPISFTNILAAEKELVFDLHLRGHNWNIWPVEVTTIDIGVFATAKKKNETSTPLNFDRLATTGTTPAEFLGNVDHLDEPIVFASGWGVREVVSTVIAQFRLRNPGSPNEDGENKWYSILRNPYDLTVRGVLKYKLLFRTHAVRICAIQGLDPTGDELRYDSLVLCDRENWDPQQDGYVRRTISPNETYITSS